MIGDPPAQAGEEAALAFARERFGAAAGLSPLAGDASTRRYFRLRVPGNTLVLALHPEPFRLEELPFVVVRDLLAGWGLPVPDVVDHDGARGILLLEDLGDETLQDVLGRGSASARLAAYDEALCQLAVLQREAARAPRGAACFRTAFDTEKLSWELHYFEKHFLEGLRGTALTVSDRTALAEAFHGLSAEIASWPRVLCHRDYHSRNLMPKDGVLHWIDFQDARMGPATYDLASLLRDAYVDLPEEFVAERIEAFRERTSPGEDRATFARRFGLVTAQRTLKALGTFGYMTTVRRTGVYLPYIPRTLANARRALASHPELAGLRRVLAQHIEELA